jgi:NADH:ubiquinone oxidoreductase subunit C
MNREELKSYMETTFPSCKVEETFDFPLIFVDKNELLSVCQKLRDSKETLFDFLFCETAIDRNPNFEVVYHLNSTTYRHDMVVKVVLEDRENPELPSVYSLWEAADLYEDEIFDLFGIRFTGHPDLRRIMLGDEWLGFPLRKDYTDENVVTL